MENSHAQEDLPHAGRMQAMARSSKNRECARSIDMTGGCAVILIPCGPRSAELATRGAQLLLGSQADCQPPTGQASVGGKGSAKRAKPRLSLIVGAGQQWWREPDIDADDRNRHRRDATEGQEADTPPR